MIIKSVSTSHVHVPELPIAVAQIRRPNTTTIWLSTHIQLRFPGQRSAYQVPIGQILGMVNLHARIPLKGRCGDVVVIANTEDRRVWVEPGQDGVGDLRHCGLVVVKQMYCCEYTDGCCRHEADVLPAHK